MVFKAYCELLFPVMSVSYTFIFGVEFQMIFLTLVILNICIVDNSDIWCTVCSANKQTRVLLQAVILTVDHKLLLVFSCLG